MKEKLLILIVGMILGGAPSYFMCAKMIESKIALNNRNQANKLKEVVQPFLGEEKALQSEDLADVIGELFKMPTFDLSE